MDNELNMFPSSNFKAFALLYSSVWFNGSLKEGKADSL